MTTRTRSTILTAAAIASLLVSERFAPNADAQQRGRASSQAATPSAMGLHGYSVVLVIGDMQSAGAGDTVPSAARKALTDMQAFLPYKRYQLLDAAWMVCCGSFRSGLSGRVRGPENGEYGYSIDTLNSTEDSKLTVRFSMREVGVTTTSAVAAGRVSSGGGGGGGRGGATGSSGSTSRNADDYARGNPAVVSDSLRVEHSRQVYEAIKERDEAELVLRTTKASYTDPHPQVVAATARYNLAQRRVEDLQHLGAGGAAGGGRGGMVPNRTVMDSTFSIALGETVVIGTSRLKGDQALIVLLTAATKPGSPR